MASEETQRSSHTAGSDKNPEVGGAVSPEPPAPARPLTLEFIEQHIGSDEGDREAVIELVREVERAHGIAAPEPLTECNDNDSPWLICKTCAGKGRCARAGAVPAPAGLPALLVKVEKHLSEYIAAIGELGATPGRSAELLAEIRLALAPAGLHKLPDEAAKL